MTWYCIYINLDESNYCRDNQLFMAYAWKNNTDLQKLHYTDIVKH